MLEREVILKCHCLLQTFNLCISWFHFWWFWL